ncbi:hypothetical protein ACH5RR_033769 [Cinchona calisaya]|uniref:Uncharacterized protein n=1 Tax=Cinchona calisaya TaxID=153742 RepID=A0ABD2YED6_9GENT
MFDCVHSFGISLEKLDQMCNRVGIFGFKRYYVVDEGEFVMVATDVLMKTWFERCVAANIREIEVYVKADQIEEEDETQMPLEYEDHEYEGSEKEAEEFSAIESDYDLEDEADEEEEEEEDNNMYDTNVDKGIEWLGFKGDKVLEERDEQADVDENSDVDNEQEDQGPDSDTDFQSVYSSDGDAPDERPVMFIPKKDMANSLLELGMIFSSKSKFKLSVKNWNTKR